MNKFFTFKVLSILIPIFLCVIAVIIHAININGEFVYDDVTYFVENNVITKASPFDFSTLFLTATNLWGEVLPFRDFLYIIQYKAFREWTTGYHIVSLILFVCSYLVLFNLLKILIKDYFLKNLDLNIGNNILIITLIITSLFLFHPVYVESFNYISGQKDALSCLFILLTIYLMYKAGREESNIVLYLILGVIVHYLAILSKLSALPSIIFIPILLIITSTRSKKNKMFLIAIWLLANIPVIIWFFHTMSILKNFTPFIMNSIPVFERVARAINIIGYHVLNIFIPWPLNFGYPLNVNWAFDIYFVIGLLFLGCFSIFAVIKRNKFVIIGFIIFMLYLAPYLNIYPDFSNDKVYDRYLAVPFVGILIALIPVIYFFLTMKKIWRNIFVIFVVLIISVLGFLTGKYVQVFQSPITGVEHTYKYFPEKKHAFFNYANQLINNLEMDKAEIVVRSKNGMRIENGEKNYMLGRIYMERREFYTAIEFFRTSSRESDSNGSFNFADGPLAMIYMILGRYDEAEPLLLKTIKDNGHPSATYRAKSMLEELKQLRASGATNLNPHQ